jgi:hypothetical protein
MTDPIPIDVNSDGVVDGYAYDTTGDGVHETLAIDANHNGIPEMVLADYDFDGVVDDYAFDRNEDGIDDAVQQGQGMGYVGGPQFTAGGYGQGPVVDTWNQPYRDDV